MAKKKKMKKRTKKKIAKFLIPLIFALVVCIAGYFFQDEIADLFGDGSGNSGLSHRPTKDPSTTAALVGNGTLGGQISQIPSYTEEGYLTVHYIDVGQGDSILITCGGQTMLIDAGENGNGDTVTSYLNDQGIYSLDLVVATHSHSDHIGSMDEVLNAISAKEVWYPEYRHGTKTENNFLAAVENCGATLRQPELGETYDLGGATVTVLGPVKCNYSQGSTDYYTDPNDMSIVIMVQYGENKFLFTGDLESVDKAETDMVDYWNAIDEDILKADVLKLGHHGSDTSTSYYFLRSVNPSYAVISVGEGNKYGHPKQDTLDILGDAEIYTYRTDYLGSIVAVSDGSTIQFGWVNGDAQPYIPD